MAKTREIACDRYTHEGCSCTRRPTIECHFRKEMQTCPKYRKLAGGKPARTDTRRQRKERADKRMRYE